MKSHDKAVVGLLNVSRTENESTEIVGRHMRCARWTVGVAVLLITGCGDAKEIRGRYHPTIPASTASDEKLKVGTMQAAFMSAFLRSCSTEFSMDPESPLLRSSTGSLGVIWVHMRGFCEFDMPSGATTSHVGFALITMDSDNDRPRFPKVLPNYEHCDAYQFLVVGRLAGTGFTDVRSIQVGECARSDGVLSVIRNRRDKSEFYPLLVLGSVNNSGADLVKLFRVSAEQLMPVECWSEYWNCDPKDSYLDFSSLHSGNGKFQRRVGPSCETSFSGAGLVTYRRNVQSGLFEELREQP